MNQFEFKVRQKKDVVYFVLYHIDELIRLRSYTHFLIVVSGVSDPDFIWGKFQLFLK